MDGWKDKQINEYMDECGSQRGHGMHSLTGSFVRMRQQPCFLGNYNQRFRDKQKHRKDKKHEFSAPCRIFASRSFIKVSPALNHKRKLFSELVRLCE